MKHCPAVRGLSVLLLALFASSASAQFGTGVPIKSKTIHVIPKAATRVLSKPTGVPSALPRPAYGKPTLGPPKIIEVEPRRSDRTRDDAVRETAGGAVAAAAAERAARRVPSGDPLLWVVKSPTATVYLFGSLHVADTSIFPLDRRVEDAFHVSGTVVFECEVTPAAKAQLRYLLQAYGTYPPGQSLDQHVDRELMGKLEASLEGAGLGREPMLRSRPWYAALLLTAAAYHRGGFDAEHGIEEHFRLEGRLKKVEHIETFAQQAAVLRDMPENEQAATLRDTLERFDELAPQLGRAVEAWRAGDVARLDKELLDPMRKASPLFYSHLMTERSAGMAAAVEDYLGRQGTTFVVIGSGHLIGDGGVVAVLTRHGYRVERL